MMDKSNHLKEGFLYIARDNDSCRWVIKIEVLEVTETTYYLHNLDSDTKYRKLIKDFHKECIIIEVLGCMQLPEFIPTSDEDAKRMLEDWCNRLVGYPFNIT